MSNSEFKARALYDFVAEGPNELSFKANDILIITSNTAGNGWWYAKNSSGQGGVIPENYVQAVADPPEPKEPPPPISTFSNAYPNLDAFPNGSRTSNPPSYDTHQYFNPPTYSNTTNWPSSPPPTNQVIEQDSFPKTLPLTSKPYDGYISVVDVSPTTNVGPFPDTNPSTENNILTDSLDGWYYGLQKTPVHNFAQSPFNFSSISSYPQQQQTPRFDDNLVPMSSSNSSLLDEVVPSSYSSTNTQSISIPPSKSETSLSSIRTNTETASSFNEDSSSLSKKSGKKRLAKFLPLSNKHKNGKKNDQKPQETPSQSNKRDTDSDDSFSDSEYPSQSSSQITNSNAQPKHASVKRTNTLPSNTSLANQSRTSMASTETSKGPPRARFFDKHGLDNYLLNGCKAKTDEHVEISFDEREGGVFWSPNPGMPPFSCKVEEPSKGTKLGGLKAFMEYKIHPQIPGSRVVGRRYKQFDWLHEQLVNKFRFICVPPLPGKQIAGRFEQEFIEERRRQLELWLNRICRHPVLCASYPVQHFITCELTEKNKKDWKTGKRKVEKDELREAPWLQCVTIINSGLSDTQITSQIDTFAQQQPGLENQFKNLSQGLSKYIERHTEVYERDIQKISEHFSKVHLAVQVDTTTPGNKDLSSSILKISGSYGGIAELYKTKGSEGLRDFNERIQEYIGLLASFPSILSIQRSAAEFMKTIQQRTPADFTSAIHRDHTLNHVVLAEINFFQKEKVNDLNVYLKTLVEEQIQFYERVTSELRDASATFK